MNSMERTMAAISHKEPDRVPLFLLLSLYGAKESNTSVEDYFSDPALVAKTQLAMKKKYRNDCFYTFFYAALEFEAFGGEVIFRAEGPANSGEPFIKNPEQIRFLEPPKIAESAGLKRVLEATELIKKEDGGQTPIIGVVMSPFSLPVMQMGFEKYLELLYFRPEEFEQLMRVNEEFCVAWANAQIDAGATAICYFDPLSSPTIIEKEKYLETGKKIARRTIDRIHGATAIHLASGISLPVVDEIIDSGALVLGFSDKDDIEKVKTAAQNRICLLGNLNGIDMVNWNQEDIDSKVSRVIQMAGQGGGLILSDNHGEIPYQVPEDVLLGVAEAVEKYGTYPLRRAK